MTSDARFQSQPQYVGDRLHLDEENLFEEVYCFSLFLLDSMWDMFKDLKVVFEKVKERIIALLSRRPLSFAQFKTWIQEDIAFFQRSSPSKWEEVHCDGANKSTNAFTAWTTTTSIWNTTLRNRLLFPPSQREGGWRTHHSNVIYSVITRRNAANWSMKYSQIWYKIGDMRLYECVPGQCYSMRWRRVTTTEWQTTRRLAEKDRLPSLNIFRGNEVETE